ncbi:SEC-C metal-binding domain-containing protein [Salinimonas lutimaris]|uniref:SEC-C metal-binding domain-containing protein n=1 Tax=Salinimonas lutimaris TaxID=914153 RepID=UPI0010BF9EB8|nr:SEC-C metal-binding domain-containing protein [Salinimonas lutimaris]
MKTGRNEKCPCGSGKKFKHCCIDISEAHFVRDESNNASLPKEQYIGFNRERAPDMSPFDLDQEAVCCLVSLLSTGAAKSLNEMHNTDKFETDHVIVTTGNCSDIQLAGPFSTLEAAFEFSMKNHGAVRFQTQPQFV